MSESALSRDFLTFESDFGWCAFYPESPCSIETTGFRIPLHCVTTVRFVIILLLIYKKKHIP